MSYSYSTRYIFFLIYFLFLTLLLLTYTGMGECSNVIRALVT